jgi:hypothetical protein
MPDKLTPRGQAASPPKKAPRKTTKKKTTRKKSSKSAPSSSTTRYVRNLHGAAGGIRVLLQNETQIKLAPRGQVGDLMPVTEEDRMDANYIANYGVLFEEISQPEARKVVEKQNTNAQAPRPTTMDQLTNEKGEPYQQSEPTIDKAFEEQGVTVAEVQKAGDGRFTEQNTQLVRPAGAPPQQQDVPGSVGNPLPDIPQDIPPEQVADWVARNQKSEGNAADALRSSLGGQAKIDPPQKT